MIIRFHPEADLEFTDAIRWYEYQREGLGSEFLLCIDEAIEKIKSNPQMYPTIYKMIHRVVVRRFPFAIFYEIGKNEIKVLAVFHSKRDPKKWKSRR